MRATELRIGNCVSNGNPVVADANTIYDIAFFKADFEPIPLTEEWLLKFGFIKHSSNPYWFRKGILCISVLGVIELISWDMQVFKIDSKIEFVHQLQNLYFALTGEELILKSL